MLTYTKVFLPIGAAIKVEGFTVDPIYVRVNVDRSGLVHNDEGAHRAVVVRAQEVDNAGNDVNDPIPAVSFSGTAANEGIVRGTQNLNDHLQHLRRKVLEAFLAERKLAAENVPSNISDLEGDV